MKSSTHNVAMLEDGEAVEVKWSRLKFQVTHFFLDFQIFSSAYFIPRPFIILYHNLLLFYNTTLY